MESQNIEYKQSWHDEYLKWVCSFANAQGGRIYIGLDDYGQVVGLPNAKRFSEDIPTPIIEETMGGMQITLWNTHQNTPQKENTEDSLSEKTLALLTANNRLSQRAIANQLGIGFDAVKEYMTKLKRTGKIQRIGADRGGYRQVTNIDNKQR